MRAALLGPRADACTAFVTSSAREKVFDQRGYTMHPIKLGSAAGLAMLVSFAAQAADLRAPVYRTAVAAVPGWSGFYAGFNGGYGWANSSTTFTPIGAVTAAGIRPIPAVTADRDLNGPLFGGHVGYNYQIASWVVGGEGDFDWAGLNNSSVLVLPILSSEPEGQPRTASWRTSESNGLPAFAVASATHGDRACSTLLAAPLGRDIGPASSSVPTRPAQACSASLPPQASTIRGQDGSSAQATSG